jgi:hypothetical protein
MYPPEQCDNQVANQRKDTDHNQAWIWQASSPTERLVCYRDNSHEGHGILIPALFASR